MSVRSAATPVRFYNYALSSASVQERVLRGLRQSEKRLPSFLLYDLRGIRLFDLLCRADESCTVAREAKLLTSSGLELRRLVGRRLTLIEYGSGTARTAVALLRGLRCAANYVPVDLSLASLRFGVRRIHKEISGIEIIPIRADFTSCFGMPVLSACAAHALVYISSCAFGTMESAEAVRVLQGAGKFCGQRGGILVGFELPDHRRFATSPRLLAAKTEHLRRSFNLNVLAHLNRRYAANFHPERFAHLVDDDADHGRQQFCLVSRTDQIVKIDQEKVRLRSGDRILTQTKRRYAWEEVEALARQAGSRIEQTWTSDGGVALCLLRPAS
jgi:L-histidine N-alpha-methyltransferase